MIRLNITKVLKSFQKSSTGDVWIFKIEAKYSGGYKFFEYESANEDFDYVSSIRSLGYEIETQGENKCQIQQKKNYKNGLILCAPVQMNHGNLLTR